MKRLAFILVGAFAWAVPVHSGSTSTPPIQNVRFAQESSSVNVVTPPTVLTHPAASYTDQARKLGIQGNVIVQGYFDADGNVTVLKVVKGLGYGLDENALAALKSWHFSPALRDGLPVSAVAEIEVPFNIENEALRRAHLEIERMRQELEQAIQRLDAARNQLKTDGQK